VDGSVSESVRLLGGVRSTDLIGLQRALLFANSIKVSARELSLSAIYEIGEIRQLTSGTTKAVETSRSCTASSLGPCNGMPAVQGPGRRWDAAAFGSPPGLTTEFVKP
jgi:hypothetical protein